MKPILLTFAGNPENQDRGLVLEDGPRLVLCVADGAGGTSGGKEAAVKAISLIRENASQLKDAASCSDLLRRMDSTIARDLGGETTCALVIITSDEAFGSSVGDSGVWLIPEEGTTSDLTRFQQRKPLIGSGGASPVPFRHSKAKGCLLLATDGLLKYTSAERIIATCRQHRPEKAAAQRLVELVRYPSGALPDDVTLILFDI